MKNLRPTASGRFRPARRQRGASLLEGIAYLGIAAIIILGAVSLLISAFSGADTNRLLQETTAIRTSVKKLYMGQSASYGTASLNTDLIAANAFPTTLAVSGANVTDAWNGAVDVTGATSQFTISYALVPKDVCINALAASSGWIKLTVNGNDIATFPITPTVATANCDNSVNSANTIVWTAN